MMYISHGRTEAIDIRTQRTRTRVSITVGKGVDTSNCVHNNFNLKVLRLLFGGVNFFFFPFL